MVKRLLDKGTYEFLEFKFEVNNRGHGIIHMIGVGKSQEKDVEFVIKIMTSVIKGWPEIRDIPEPPPEKEKEPEEITVKKPQSRRPGRPPLTDKDA